MGIAVGHVYFLKRKSVFGPIRLHYHWRNVGQASRHRHDHQADSNQPIPSSELELGSRNAIANATVFLACSVYISHGAHPIGLTDVIHCTDLWHFRLRSLALISGDRFIVPPGSLHFASLLRLPLVYLLPSSWAAVWLR